MKTNRFVFFLLAGALIFLTAGCPKEEPPAPEVVKPPPADEALKVDPSKLPPPRPALESAPDLSEGTLVVNDATTDKMIQDGVPADVITGLGALRGQEFTNASKFAAAVRDALGDKADAFMEAIMRNALVMQLADEAWPPGAPPPVVVEKVVEKPGAPPPVIVETTDFEIVYFDFDKSEIKPEFESAIRANAEQLLGKPNLTVTIEGHCDERGTNEYNLALGQRRAEAIRQALIAEGVPASQLKTVSFGEERPVASGSNEEAWALNRRSVIKNF